MFHLTENAAMSQHPPRPSLPHLFRNVKRGHVVLFSDEHSGVLLNIARSNLTYIGVTESDWVSCWDTENWRPFLPGESVTLTAN